MSDAGAVDLEAITASRGCRVRYPAPCEIFLDLDSEGAVAFFEKQWEIFSAAEPLAAWTMTPSKTTSHYHVVVTVPFLLSDSERIGWQAVLGSDRKHELLSRLAVGKVPQPTCFFEPL